VVPEWLVFASQNLVQIEIYDRQTVQKTVDGTVLAVFNMNLQLFQKYSGRAIMYVYRHSSYMMQSSVWIMWLICGLICKKFELRTNFMFQI